jgi:hypothetical protein
MSKTKKNRKQLPIRMSAQVSTRAHYFIGPKGIQVSRDGGPWEDLKISPAPIQTGPEWRPIQGQAGQATTDELRRDDGEADQNVTLIEQDRQSGDDLAGHIWEAALEAGSSLPNTCIPIEPWPTGWLPAPWQMIRNLVTLGPTADDTEARLREFGFNLAADLSKRFPLGIAAQASPLSVTRVPSDMGGEACVIEWLIKPNQDGDTQAPLPAKPRTSSLAVSRRRWTS